MEPEETGEQKIAGAADPQQTGGGKTTVEGQPATTTPAAEGSADIQAQVEAFKAKARDETQKRQAAEETVRIYQDQLALTRANQQPQQPTTLYNRVIEKLGYQDEEFLDKEQQGNVFNAMLDVISTSNAQQSFVSQHSDFAEVVGTNDPISGQFRIAAPLQRVLDKDPQLAQGLLNNPNAVRIAYRLAITDPVYLASKKTEGLTPEQLAAQQASAAIKTANAQASISSVTGGGNLDKAAVIQNMTPEEFNVYKEKILAKGGVT